jgi:hypothetical protein
VSVCQRFDYDKLVNKLNASMGGIEAFGGQIIGFCPHKNNNIKKEVLL